MSLRTRMRSLTTESLLNTVQALAIVIGGCWVMYQYLTHERELANVSLEQQRLSTAQAKALASTQVAAENARLRQLELANKQAEVALSRQHEAQELAVEQQRLSNEQSRLTLQINESQRSLRHDELAKTVELLKHDVQLKRLQEIKTQREVDNSGRYKFERTFSLTSAKERDINEKTAEYAVRFSFDFANRSDLPFEISVFIIDYYVGMPLSDTDTTTAVRPISLPRDRWNPGRTEDGALLWQHVGATGSIHAEAVGRITEPWDYVIEGVHLGMGPGGTGVVKPGLTLGSDDTYLVRAPKGGYIAFVMSYCFERCKNNDDLYSITKWTTLDADTNSAAPPTPNQASGR
jgi:hypothetical protein